MIDWTFHDIYVATSLIGSTVFLVRGDHDVYGRFYVVASAQINGKVRKKSRISKRHQALSDNQSLMLEIGNQLAVKLSDYCVV